MNIPRPGLAHGQDALEKRVSGAFSAMTGQGGEEQEEDQLLQDLQRAMDQANKILMKLRGVQKKEKGDGAGGAKINDDSSTGSPSMQGMP